MAFLSDDKLQRLHQSGKAQTAGPKQVREEPQDEDAARLKVEQQKSRSLQAIADLIRNLTPAAAHVRLEEQKLQVLQSISAALQALPGMFNGDQIAAAIEQLKQEQAPAEPKRWVFSVIRDAKGKISEIEAVQE